MKTAAIATPNLPPGEYYMVALTEFDSQELYEPAFLEQVAAVVVQDHDRRRREEDMDLKLRER